MAYNPYATVDTTTYRYPDRMRKFFGEHSNNADPMITGYGFVFFTKLPPALNSDAHKNMLTAACTNYTPTDLTINQIEYQGRDGGKWYVPGQATTENSISFTFWELVGLPIYNMIANWVMLLRNPQYGYMTETTWRQANYKGKMILCSCTPDMEVQWAKSYGGIWPTGLKEQPFSGAIDNQEKVTYEVSFQYDHYGYTSSEVIAAASRLVSATLNDVDTVVRSKYTDAGTTE